MIRIFGRSLLSTILVFQAVQPALACNCEAIDDSCGCATECTSCEPVVVESEPCDACGGEVVTSPCGCEAEVFDSPATDQIPADKTPEPQPAESNKPRTFVPPAKEQPAQVETPAPTLDTPTTELPAAPINVPSEPATESSPEVFPGPAPVETTPAQEPTDSTPATTPSTNTEGLFDDPAPVATPSDSTPPAATTPAVEESTESATVTEDLFVEPSQPAPDSPDTDEPVTEESSTEADPLDDLFGAPTAEPEPQAEPETQPESDTKPKTEDTEKTDEAFDPFSYQDLPKELDAPGGLASSDFRNWSNRAASFRCDARLVRVTTDGVFLAQPSGEFVAMAFSQLSDADLSFVREQVRAQRTVLARAADSNQLAARTAQ